MKSEHEVTRHPCEYANCDEDGTVFDEELGVWLCEKHSDSVDDETGYCGTNCRLGWGCDQSC